VRRSPSEQQHAPVRVRRRRPLLDELIALAQRFGRDPEFSRGGGGNASVKADGILWIKPSGVPLATLAADDLVPLGIEPLLAELEAPAKVDEHGEDPVMRAAEVARLAPAGGRRPSVELLFHALMPERYVLHTHPIMINSVTCNRAASSWRGRCSATTCCGCRTRIPASPWRTPSVTPASPTRSARAGRCRGSRSCRTTG
jgi:rhamnose utilization protein RhaD (predicted bifunctional aldolase and dehydrogenase)